MIRPPTINLARRPFRNNTVYYAVFGTCFAVLLAASVYNVYDYVHTGEDLSLLEADLAERTQVYMALREDVEKMKRDISGLNLKTLDSKSSFANGLILSRLFSWSTLFDRMEDLIPPDVKIRSIRPSISPTGIEIQIDGLARTAEEMYEFETNLSDSDFFFGVYPVSENTRESKTEINFDLVMNYIPAGETGSAAPDATQPAAASQETQQGGEEEAASDEAPAGDTQAQASEPGTDAAAGEPAGQVAAQPQPAATEPAPEKPQPSPTPLMTGPVPPPVGMGVHVDTQAAQQDTRPLSEYTNKEFIDTYGEAKFLRMRGGFVPVAKNAADGVLSNLEYIQKYGLEKFIADRGGLDRRTQQPGGAK